MLLLSLLRSKGLCIAALSTLLPFASAERLIESKSLNPCQDNSLFTATLFNVAFTPDNNSLAFDIVGVSSISGHVTAEIDVIAYGYNAVHETLDPCTQNLEGMCPMNTGQINIQSNLNIPDSVIKDIPTIAYGVPDLDGLVKIYIRDRDTNKSLACVEAELSNGKTVDQLAVGWTTAVIAGLALLASAVTSGLGHSNTAAHVAANALSLFGFFQAQAIIGMTAVPLPPIVASWTQNFEWSLGIIKVGFLESICTWYQRATGGSPSTLLSNLNSASVEVQKRSIEGQKIVLRAAHELAKRADTPAASAANKVNVVEGIKRVGFRAKIEITNIFLTGLIFFMIFVFFTALCVIAFKGFCEMAVKAGWFKGDKFEDFRTGWKVVLKGILFRLVLIGYPQICILCLWELTQRDSAAEVVLALFFFVAMSISLVWASLKVFRIAKRSMSMHKNPAYILYSDPSALNKWGFLYVQFRATAYYFIMPMLGYILVKALFIAFAQGSGTTQAVALVIIEAGFLIAVSILRPWMDKKTNAFNISIAAINFLNVIFLLVFTAVFNQPAIVTGVMGVIFFIYNAAFALVLLLLVLIATGYAVFSKNPDTRYQPMRDDRGSFIKSQTQLNTELDALGVTARGDMAQKGYYGRDLDDDDSFSSGSGIGKNHEAQSVPLPPSTANSAMNPPRSPIDPNMQYFPSDGAPRHGAPQYSDNPRGMYSGDNLSSRQETSPYRRAPSSHSSNGYRQQNNTSPWQRGAGYDH
ncbi:putative flavin carrier protein 3 [Lecanora helva]